MQSGKPTPVVADADNNSNNNSSGDGGNHSFLADARDAASAATATAQEAPSSSLLPLPLLEPNAAYDADMPLDERERRWGFTLADLCAATRVVRTLFRNPALFVGDGYLADSRLYTMITRDRATKRAHRDVYKAIMNAERTRRRRYERVQYMETVRKTAMKREREEALHALLLIDDGNNNNSAGDAQDRGGLLLAAAAAAESTGADTSVTTTTAARDEDNNDDDKSRAATAVDVATPVTADGTPLSPHEQHVLRLIGAFENLLRIDAVHTGVGGDDDNNNANNNATSHTHKDKGKEAAVTGTDGGDADTRDAVTLTQLTAQYYRYLPHMYGSQMPPPLFAGRVPPHLSPVERLQYLVGAKLQLAQMANDVAPLPRHATSAAREDEADSNDNDEEEEALSLPQHLQRRGGAAAAADVAVCTPAMSWLSSIAQLRACFAAVTSEDKHDKEAADNDDNDDDEEQEQTATRMAATRRPPTLPVLPRGAVRTLSHDAHAVLQLLQSVLLGRSGDDGSSDNNDEASTLTAARLSPSGDLTVYDVALQSLHVYIARRVYQYPRVNACGVSPRVVARAPPTSASTEPDTYCAFDDVQCYAASSNVYTSQAQQEQARHGGGGDGDSRGDGSGSSSNSHWQTTASTTQTAASLRLSRWVSCHTCKVRYNVLHPYYYSLCHLCGEYNYNKRLLARDLRGKVVLLTGCRIKIGYAMAISLLRCGATLLGITRFVHEAAARFQQEPDYAVWQHRLHLFAIDLRDLWLVTQFCAFVQRHFPRLFAIVNNATQTIARTPQYTAHLRAIERHPAPELQRAIAGDRYAREWHSFFLHHTSVTVGQPLTIEHQHHVEPFLDEHATTTTTTTTTTMRLIENVTDASDGNNNNNDNDDKDKNDSVAGDGSSSSSTAVATSASHDRALVFDRYDTQAEESDARAKNSWVLELAEVPTGEAAEVMAINALAPFIINSKLKPCLLARDAGDDEARFIINVSAMEGQFYRYKQTTHPHTNMAKAALNMMTRTSGEDYARDGIYMNAVDTGWITDESPMLKKHRRAEQYMLCPLDEVDAAARCLDLIYTDSRVYGKFYKDYKEIAW